MCVDVQGDAAMAGLFILTLQQVESLLDDLPDDDTDTADPAVVHSVYGDAAAMDDEQFEAFMKARGLRKRILPT